MSDMTNLGRKTVVRIAEKITVTEFLHSGDGCSCRFWLEGDAEPEFCPFCGVEIVSIREP